MSDTAPSKAWIYMSFTPSVIAFTGITLVMCARTFQWGADNDIPAADLIALFFAEITMVASGLGIAAYIKSRYKTVKVKLFGLWNLSMLIISGTLGYNIFGTL